MIAGEVFGFLMNPVKLPVLIGSTSCLIVIVVVLVIFVVVRIRRRKRASTNSLDPVQESNCYENAPTGGARVHCAVAEQAETEESCSAAVYANATNTDPEETRYNLQ